MNQGTRIFLQLCAAAIFLAACSSTPRTTEATQPSATSKSSATPAPAGSGYPAPTAKPSGSSGAPVKTQAGYPASQTSSQDAYPAQGGGLVITLAGGAKQTLTLDVLKSLPTVTANLEGKDQPYRKLADVLAKAGATNINKATVTGKASALDLTKDQVGQAYVDVQADGQIRVLVKGVPAPQWPVNVTAISVQ